MARCRPKVSTPLLRLGEIVSMRLTLRTLLAWLDDTLSPTEVREIGKQVSESPFAKELVEKIHRVTRQRRLTVPPDQGPDSVDPNIVARYLDNDLDPDLVAELEKKCLTSDVHLAEVASVHQILSLIGQKAKVPVEARHRMYQLFKGREAVKPQASRASRQTEPTPRSEPVQPWISSPLPSRPWIEQYGPAAAVLGLMTILGLTAWKTLSTPETPPRGRTEIAGALPLNPNQAAVNAAKAEPKDLSRQVPPDPNKKDATDPEKLAKDDKTNALDGDEMPAKEPKAENPGAGDPTPAIAPGSVGLVKNPTGVLLRISPGRRDWERINGPNPLKESDRIMNLDPFRNTVEIGKADVDLVGATEIWSRATPPNLASRLALSRGRVVLHGTAPSLPFEIQFAGKSINVTPPPGGIVGVERLNRRSPGQTKAAGPVVRFFAAEGPVKIESGSNATTLDSAGAVSVASDGTFTDESANAPPRWVTETEPAPYDQERGEQFLKFLPADRSLMACLVEASEDDQKEVCRLAISALHSVGDISLIVPLLNAKGNATAAVRRKAAIAVLRDSIAEGPEAAKELRDQLNREFGDELAATTEKLLVGYTPAEAADDTTFAKLVQILGDSDPNDVGVRELALENLMALTGRDELDYDPARPTEGKGLDAWRKLLHSKELKPRNSTPKAEK